VDDLNTFAVDAVMSSLVSTFTKWRRCCFRRSFVPFFSLVPHILIPHFLRWIVPGYKRNASFSFSSHCPLILYPSPSVCPPSAHYTHITGANTHTDTLLPTQTHKRRHTHTLKLV
jgi:hypothetical protein